MVLLRGPRLQAHPGHARVAGRAAVPGASVADAGRATRRQRSGTQARRDGALPIAAPRARSRLELRREDRSARAVLATRAPARRLGSIERRLTDSRRANRTRHRPAKT